jgi:hypothetical protein
VRGPSAWPDEEEGGVEDGALSATTMEGNDVARMLEAGEPELLLLRSALSASAGRWRSGLWLSLLAMLAAGLFLDLKTFRKRPPGDADRRFLGGGGARAGLLRDSEGVESRVLDSVVSGGTAELRERRSESSASGVRMSWRWSAWTRGDDVVR